MASVKRGFAMAFPGLLEFESHAGEMDTRQEALLRSHTARSLDAVFPLGIVD